MRQLYAMAFVTLATAAGTLTNAHAQEQQQLQDFIVSPLSVWKYQTGETDPGDNWMNIGYDDANWASGKAGFGYGDDDDNTVIENMEDHFDTVYIRKSFELSAKPDKLYLYVYYDDAFVAYVNGKKVKSMGKIGKHHEAKGFEVFNIKRKHFVEGTNLIAIKGMNASLSSSDFSLWPALATRRDALNPAEP